MRPSVLVTGGAGYVGSHACKTLAASGFLPIAYDNLERGHAWAVRWGPLVRGDVRDRHSLQKAFAAHRPVAVMHFAAYAYVDESVREPAMYYDNNVAGTITLLEAMRQHDCRDIVFSSSCATYGVPRRLPIDEAAPKEPINPYGRSKLMVERILADLAAAYEFRFMALRYFNAAGADPEGETGEDHAPETHLLPLIILTALGQRPHLAVYGSDYPTPDGTAVRDYVHVSDLAAAHVLALRHLRGTGESMALNLGAGRGRSVREMIAAVEREAGTRIPTREEPRRAGDPPSLVADVRLAHSVLGWTPVWDLEAIVRTAWAWFASRAPEYGAGTA